MPPAEPQWKRRYTRSDPRGGFPWLYGLSDLEYNRLAMFWRPIIDMTDSELAPMRLRIIRHVSAWLAEPETDRWSWFAMIGVSGLRHQVLRHAGLRAYECADPRGLPEKLRTPQWSVLVEAIERFSRLDDRVRALVVFQLAQLSYCEFAIQLAGPVQPDGDPSRDRYAYEVARIRARVPGRAPESLAVFERLATSCKDPRLALAACSQGIGHSIRGGADLTVARDFERHAERLTADGLPDDWHMDLVRSRYHRAAALLRLAERRSDEMRADIDAATHFSDRLYAASPQGPDRVVADENRRILVESKIKAAARARGEETATEVRRLCEELNALDPMCVEARLVVADGHATIGDHGQAARWYERAGELCTGAGVLGWYRAAQIHDRMGDRSHAMNAMGRCLELDTTAVEPRRYLTGALGG